MVNKSVINQELTLSDEEFREAYIEKNRQWLVGFRQEHPRKKLVCGERGCREEFQGPEDFRPYGGINYCPSDFAKHALEEITSVRGFNTVENSLRSEWLLKIARVMDTAIVRNY